MSIDKVGDNDKIISWWAKYVIHLAKEQQVSISPRKLRKFKDCLLIELNNNSSRTQIEIDKVPDPMIVIPLRKAGIKINLNVRVRMTFSHSSIYVKSGGAAGHHIK